MKTVFHLILIALVCIHLSCERDSEGFLLSDADQGIFILNEGTFGNNNSSVSYYNEAEQDTLQNNIFLRVNGVEPGDVISSYTEAGDYGFLVVNNSGKTEIVDKKTFQVAAAPIVTSYPRYALNVNDTKVYISDGSMAGNVYVVDLSTLLITDTIAVGMGPEMMVQLNNKVYVANSGGWAKDSTISVINVNTNTVEDVIHVGDVPTQLALDMDDRLVVMCRGYAQYENVEPYNLISESKGKIVVIDMITHTIEWEEETVSASEFIIPPKLSMDKVNNLLFYLLPDGIYKTNMGRASLPAQPEFPGSYTGLGIDNQTGNLFVLSGGYTGAGKCDIYNSLGELQSSYEVGIIPAQVVF